MNNPKIECIASLEDPRMAPFLSMRRQEIHRQEGYFIAEGPLVVERLLKSDHPVESLLVPEDWREGALEMIRETGRMEVTLLVAPKTLLETFVGFHLYQGVMALGRIQSNMGWERIWEKQTSPRLWIALDGLVNAENVGVILRNAAALGVGAVFAHKNCSSPWLRRTVRCSMGGIFSLEIVEGVELPEILKGVRQKGMRCLAVDTGDDYVHPWEEDLKEDICLVFGKEVGGICPEVSKECDRRVAIPMGGGISSLNVANATAVMLYEVQRQRGSKHCV